MTASGSCIIQANDVHKYYDKLHVLKGVDLSIERGKIVSIVGKSGAGKSTLLHLLGTLDRADRGQIRIEGSELSGLKGKALARFRNERIGFIFQFHHLLPEFTAVENACMPALIRGGSESAARRRAMELLDYLGLSDRAGHRPAQLSGGEAQRVAVARALINQPSVVLADEPSGNLDTQTSQDLHALFFKLRADFGQTFVIVTHNLELAAMSDRQVSMSDGRIVEPQTDKP